MNNFTPSAYSKTTINRMIRKELTPVFMKLQDDYNNLLATSHEEISSFKEELSISHCEYDKKKEQVENIKDEKHKLKELNDALTDRIHELNFDIDNLKKQVDLKSDNYVQMFNEQTHNLQEDLMRTKDENINLKKEIDERTKKINIIKEQLKALLD